MGAREGQFVGGIIPIAKSKAKAFPALLLNLNTGLVTAAWDMTEGRITSNELP